MPTKSNPIPKACHSSAVMWVYAELAKLVLQLGHSSLLRIPGVLLGSLLLAVTLVGDAWISQPPAPGKHHQQNPAHLPEVSPLSTLSVSLAIVASATL